MSIVHPNQARPADPAVGHQDLPQPPVTSPSTGHTPRTRTGAARLAVYAAATASVVLIVFMLQNTRSVEVTFLWMHGKVPLALALLIAGVSVAALSMTVGAARIGRLRRLARRHR